MLSHFLFSVLLYKTCSGAPLLAIEPSNRANSTGTKCKKKNNNNTKNVVVNMIENVLKFNVFPCEEKMQQGVYQGGNQSLLIERHSK